ncbi:hypothetical protein [Stieleria varia]|uniref:Uncharacterized protein n=1 Tax=Stieleria varia TaxID=2528005 RepID=A0A5C5ZW85_9BACT|nr:hypothetical protein [Stieleria varia]TWT91298.1 hypothetical protein Pla52n_66320 [Stieleria varia]
MQLDQTHVKVRVRTLSEIGDLSLIMLRHYPRAIFGAFAIGAAPWVLLNALLLYWLPIREASYGLEDEEARAQLLRYGWWMCVLVFLQTPAAGIVTTIYLGEAVFEQRPTVRSAIKKARSQFWRWFPRLAIYRMAVPAMVLAAMMWGSDGDAAVDVFLLGMLLVWALIVRGARPFLPEMIVLEMCPVRSKDPAAITLRRRSKALHGPGGGDVGSRFIVIGMTLIVIGASFLYGMTWVQGVITGKWKLGLMTLLVYFPLSLWLISGIAVLVRLLAYLDTRIRFEGWDVELALRAEAMRQFGDEDSPIAQDPRSINAKRVAQTTVKQDQTAGVGS